MKKHHLLVATALLVATPAMYAQRWEFGGGAGGGFYTSRNVTNPAITGTARIGPGLTASAWLANNNTEHWGGEIRYDFQQGELQLKSGGGRATFSGMSHAVHYDIHLHTTGQDARVRPFFAFGGGVKVYRGTGTEVAAQPLNNLALLTKTTDLRPMASVGAGIKVNGRRMGFRIEAHDYMSPFPSNVIAPAMNSSVSGWIHDFVVSAGISFFFF
jgi:hypothetical protein